MKKLLPLMAACGLLSFTQHAYTQANRKLNNLASPTAINQSLIPGVKSLDLGVNDSRWRNLYMNGRLGIKNNPEYPVDISNNSYMRAINIFNQKTGEAVDRYALYASSVVSDFYGYGVYGEGGYLGVYGAGKGGASQFTSIGVYGHASGTANVGSRYGIYGYATGGSFNAAGYFNGMVYASNYYNISDRKFKTNIDSLNTPLELLMKLRPRVYEFKTKEYPGMGLPKGIQIGLIADEVKQVFPELVSEAIQPARYGKDKTEVLSPEITYESVNYIELIPVLIASIQQQQRTIDDLRNTQQKTIDALQAENELLNARLASIEQAMSNNSKIAQPVSVSEARLETVMPNPSGGQTLISYYLPQNTGKAVIHISDMKGAVIKSIPLTAVGKGQVTLDAQQYATGIYNCALVVKGQLVDTKKLVLTK